MWTRPGRTSTCGPNSKNILKANAKRFDFILGTVSAQHDYNTYLNLLRHDGTMVLIGIPDPVPLTAGSLVMQRRKLAGSLIGGIRETWRCQISTLNIGRFHSADDPHEYQA